MDGRKQIRLQKFLASQGIASRRKSEQLIMEGHVKVNGALASIGDKVTPGIDKVLVGGKVISTAKEDKKYIMLNKPRGYITTMQDEQGRKCVADLAAGIDGRVYPVGRLDRESEGLLIMTNDGDFANNIIHPSRHISKTYRVTIRPGINDVQLAAMCGGIEIDGKMTVPARVHIISEEPGRVVIEVILEEGRNRQIRKMCESLGIEVARLKRVAIGKVRLGMLAPGKWRTLRKEEIEMLNSVSKVPYTP